MPGPSAQAGQASRLQAGAVASLLLLMALCVAWESFLAPLRPGGSWLTLKVIPLLVPLRGILAGRRFTYQWSTMLILVYAAEGITRAMTDPWPANACAVAEFVLAAVFFCCAIAYVRTSSSPAGNTAP
ncbi:MAG TPA: DUF2069 domain-containing protein [Usitatibacteraceae bacterium]|nr:DUF2069 domain-containing protein [Usitatibacteraceae bacterium]